MSLRSLVFRFWTHGRGLLRAWRPRGDPYIVRSNNISATAFNKEIRSSSGFQKHYENARKILANNILRRVTNPVSSDLRKRTTQQLIYGGNSTPFFAFVGISLASGSIISKEDELEGLCWEIREAVERMQGSLSEAESDLFQEGEAVDLRKFVIGPPLGKGANAAVYAAKIQQTDESCSTSSRIPAPETGPSYEPSSPASLFPFALKMMFNFDIESNATSILRSMFRETIPARIHYIAQSEAMSPWMKSMYEGTVSLPPHPNIVTMHCAFVDDVYQLPKSCTEFPAALPPRINPLGGYGRNMTLYLLMKRYDTTLKDYLSSRKVEDREAILIVAQLLEAVAHINRHSIAHRDMKSDNALVETDPENGGCPLVALTDFGCALADGSTGLCMPFRTYDTDRGGNPALMAPEVATAVPGLLSVIDYSKADLWGVGAISAELLLGYNPFYREPKNPRPLHSSSYHLSELPPLPAQPWLLSALTRSLLAVRPSQRPSAELAANVLQLFLWAPSHWLKAATPPSTTEVMQWLLCLTTKVLTTASFGGRRSEAEYRLIASFLRRARLAQLRQALLWLRAAATQQPTATDALQANYRI